MDPESFRTLSEQVHRRWLARKLRMQTTEGSGIDLWNDRFGIELKTSHGPRKWATHAYQYDWFREENPTKELYWAFLRYEMSETVRAFRGDAADLARRITYREVFFLPWDWILCRPVTTPRTGPYRHVTYGNVHGRKATRIPQTFMLLHPHAALILPTGSTLEAYVQSI